MTQTIVETTPAEPVLFSVIIPCYNAAGTVGRAVASACSQTLENLEVIVVDNGSTDGSIDAARAAVGAYPDKTESLHVLHQPRKGAAAARNLGMAQARGRYLALLDADDYWDPDYLSSVTAVFERHPEVGVVSAISVQTDGDNPQLALSSTSHDHVLVDDFFQAAYDHTVPTATSSVCLRASVVAQVGGMREDLVRAQDTEYWMRLAAHGVPWAYCPRPLVYIDKSNEQSLSRSPAMIRHQASPDTWSRDIWPLLTPEQLPTFRRFHVRRTLNLCGAHLRVGNYACARRAAREALPHSRTLQAKLLLTLAACAPGPVARVAWSLGPRTLQRLRRWRSSSRQK